MVASIQQHRAAIGMFNCNKLAAFNKKLKTNRAVISDSENLSTRICWLYIGVILTCLTLEYAAPQFWMAENPPWKTLHESRESVSNSAIWIVNVVSLHSNNFARGLLILLAGDIETNPGPVSAEALMQGLARLASSAPAGCVKNILLTWAPNKDVKVDLDRLFKVTELKEALIWLKNCQADNSYIKNLKRKSDILDAVLIALERLLPELCPACTLEYSTDRECEPAVQCAGCHQGFHQQCPSRGENTGNCFKGRKR